MTMFDAQRRKQYSRCAWLRQPISLVGGLFLEMYDAVSLMIQRQAPTVLIDTCTWAIFLLMPDHLEKATDLRLRLHAATYIQHPRRGETNGWTPWFTAVEPSMIALSHRQCVDSSLLTYYHHRRTQATIWSCVERYTSESSVLRGHHYGRF